MLSGDMMGVNEDTISTTEMASNNSNSNSNSNVSVNKEKEVFNISDNMFTYNEARAVCAAHDAKLASLEEMIEEYIRLDGYGHALNSYDGGYSEITLNNIDYIYFRN